MRSDLACLSPEPKQGGQQSWPALAGGPGPGTERDCAAAVSRPCPPQPPQGRHDSGLHVCATFARAAQGPGAPCPMPGGPSSTHAGSVPRAAGSTQLHRPQWTFRREVAPVGQPPSAAPTWPAPSQLRPPSSFLGLNLELVCWWEGVHKGVLCILIYNAVRFISMCSQAMCISSGDTREGHSWRLHSAPSPGLTAQ